ncbi:acyclic terpene utilization AtuA family protein [Psychrobacillus sp. INOP01]|uniref:acyclic terpene utilization AtuA family protein n=1 Tax=Psychrobacillus sp. INOP01 TaxID=2829187 RepID=UPI001BADB854|nr:acyclic terpene utilization AtuA family protein [Psychrobacillus sp. INOP01]QUG40693.1 acyclic terpene utilization AtuA family protein [Psychrobacillus sp. INOP01]
MGNEIKILSPCGMLGYGFPEESFLRGMEEEPHGIVVDAGSTDAGPHKLGAGVSIVSRRAAKKDLTIILENGVPRKIPIIIGSAGGAGAQAHVDWTMDIIEEILKEAGLQVKIAIVWADIPNDLVIEANQQGRIKPLSPNIPPLNEDIILETNGIVAQMGHEPILEALQKKADIIVCGRAYDPSPFAAIGIFHGKDPGLSYHLGKILECGALCAEPGTTKDSILGIIGETSFKVKSLNPKRKCTSISVAAHTFYEKEHPYILHGPGFTLNLEQCEFKELADGVVEVSNSKYIPTEQHFIKLEGARKVAYRTFVLAGIRDPILLENVEDIENRVKQQVSDYYDEIPSNDYKVNFYNYGMNAVLGDKEKEVFSGHEIGVVIEVIAKDQELANSICATARSTFLHFAHEKRKSTAGNLAFPFAPSDIEFGPVYEFSVYHLLEIADNPFRIEYR